jgi:hypothetical protein
MLGVPVWRVNVAVGVALVATAGVLRPSVRVGRAAAILDSVVFGSAEGIACGWLRATALADRSMRLACGASWLFADVLGLLAAEAVSVAVADTSGRVVARGWRLGAGDGDCAIWGAASAGDCRR